MTDLRRVMGGVDDLMGCRSNDRVLERSGQNLLRRHLLVAKEQVGPLEPGFIQPKCLWKREVGMPCQFVRQIPQTPGQPTVSQLGFAKFFRDGSD